MYDHLKDSYFPGLISVIIPHYNSSEYLSLCLASLTKQTYQCFEVYVIDDNSDEANEANRIVELYKSLIPVKFLKTEYNKGASGARNYGSRFAQGEYLFFCDADVELYSQAFELLIKCLIEIPNANFAYGGFFWGNNKIPPVKFDKQELFRQNYISTMSLIRHVYFPQWDESLKRFQDWDLWLKMIHDGSDGVCCNEYLFETPEENSVISTEKNISFQEAMQTIKNKWRLE